MIRVVFAKKEEEEDNVLPPANVLLLFLQFLFKTLTLIQFTNELKLWNTHFLDKISRFIWGEFYLVTNLCPTSFQYWDQKRDFESELGSLISALPLTGCMTSGSSLNPLSLDLLTCKERMVTAP